MTHTDPPGLVPDGMTTDRQDLPMLAWLTCRAYAHKWRPNDHRLRTWELVRAALSWPIRLPPLAVRRESIAWVGDGHAAAMATITPTKKPTGPVAVGSLLVGILIALVALFAWQHTWPMIVLFALALIGLLAMNPVAVVKAQVPLRELYEHLAAEDPAAEIYEIGNLAAWPPGNGMGLGLLDSLLELTPATGYAICFPRDEGLRAKYVEHGLVPFGSQGAMYKKLEAHPGAERTPGRATGS